MTKTRFGSDCPILFVSAQTGTGLATLSDAIKSITATLPERSTNGAMHIAFDHCFLVKGQGAVFTGTVISGTIRKGQKVIFPYTRESGEVRSIQKFRIPSDSATQGDRVGICIPGINTDKERGDIYADLNQLMSSSLVVFAVRRIRFYKLDIASGANFHIAIGHTHCMGTPYFFKPATHEGAASTSTYVHSHGSLLGSGGLASTLESGALRLTEVFGKPTKFDFIEQVNSIDNDEIFYCALVFSKAILCLPGSLMIASKLDLDGEHQSCRLAFYGKALPLVSKDVLSTRIIKVKTKEGFIDRQQGDDNVYLVRGLLKKGGGGIDRYIGRSLTHDPTGIHGVIESTFGKSGLLRVSFDSALPCDCLGSKVLVDIEKPALAKILERVYSVSVVV